MFGFGWGFWGFFRGGWQVFFSFSLNKGATFLTFWGQGKKEADVWDELWNGCQLKTGIFKISLAEIILLLYIYI